MRIPPFYAGATSKAGERFLAAYPTVLPVETRTRVGAVRPALPG
jgi:hypothetical protein